MASIKDVAKLAGVSYTTVSHVINSTRHVSPDTAKKVRDAITQCGYSPSHAARTLRCGKSRTVGVIDTTPVDVFFMEVMRHAQRTFEEERYNLYYSFSETYDLIAHPENGDICNSSCFIHNTLKENEYIDQMTARDVDAVIINPISPDDIIASRIAEAGIPFVLFQRTIPESGALSVVSDDFSGGYQAVEYLASLGHRKIAVVHGCGYESHTVRKRHDGVNKALSDFGISLPDGYRAFTAYHAGEAYRVTKRLLSLPDPPSAVFYFSDIMAMAGMRAVRDMGLDVPGDISIAGYDDIHLSDYLIPRLTTVNQDKRMLGELLARTVLGAVENTEGPEKNVSPGPLPVTLVVRDSCAKISG